MDNGWALVKDIQNEHRLEKPKFAPNFFGEIMKNCWQKDPKERPTFSHLAEMMDSLVSLDYLNMNEPTGESELIEETIDLQHDRLLN
jgi:hypothetical protein